MTKDEKLDREEQNNRLNILINVARAQLARAEKKNDKKNIELLKNDLKWYETMKRANDEVLK